MDVYQYNAAHFCDDCGEQIAADLRADGVADSGDSGDFPQGPYPDGGGESDSPEHCDGCGCFLGGSLTSDGFEYVLERLDEATRRTDSLDEWRDFYGDALEAPAILEKYDALPYAASPEEIERVRDLYGDGGLLEIDDDAAVSVAQDGSGRWVAAWVWLPTEPTSAEHDAGAAKCPKCGECFDCNVRPCRDGGAHSWPIA